MIKEYHVSENLFDGTYTKGFIGTTYIYRNTGTSANCAIISVSPNTTYTVTKYDESNRFAIGTSSVLPYDEIQLTGIYYVDTATTYTFTTDNSAQYMVVYVSTGTEQAEPRLMINVGSTALPYEPYGNTWNTKSYCKATTGSKTYSNFPIVVRSREQSISSWNMKGDEQHTGTASPTSPIEINGTGDRTKNLVYSSQTQTVGTDLQILQTIGSTEYILNKSETESAVSTATLCDMTLQAGTYTITVSGINRIENTNDFDRVFIRDSNTNIVVSEIMNNTPKTFTLSETTTLSKIIFVAYMTSTYNNNKVTIMLNSGSTAIPYEPYGYKIPISANGTALTPVYLTEQLMQINDYADSLDSNGTVTYNIYKHELTGQETWNRTSAGKMYSSDALNGIPNYLHTLYEVTMMCTHYKPDMNYGNTSHLSLNEISLYGTEASLSIREIYIYPDGYATAADFATYLQQQYANGTPVTIWFIMETPTTEQVTVPTIPTTSSPTTIDVNTSVKPSEMSLAYDGYKICKPTKIVIPEPSEWIAKSWNGYNKMVGSSIWSDGDNIYYSMAMYQYILNKSTSTWSAKTWNGLTSFNGAHIWTDGDSVYYSFGDDQYVLNRQTSTWSAKTWKGLTSFDGGYVWTDGDNIYYSSSSNQYILDKATSTWVEKEWNGLTSFDGSSVWFEGNNIYYSYGLTRYVLNKSTSTWSEKVWTSAPYYMDGGKIWSVNGYTFYSNGTYEQYVLDKSTSTWSTKTWTGFTSFSERNIWTDGTNIYVSDGSGKQYVLVR